MSPLALFLVGALVTLVTLVGLALPVAGAILDGRDEARRRAREPDAPAAADEGSGPRLRPVA